MAGSKDPLSSRGWAQAESVAREGALGQCCHSIVTAISWRAWWGFRDPESTRGGERSCRRGEPGSAGHGVTSFGGSDTASGACSSDGWHRLPRVSCKAAAVAIALLDPVRLEGQRRSDTVEFLSRRKDQVQYNSQSLLTSWRTLTKDEPHALHSG